MKGILKRALCVGALISWCFACASIRSVAQLVVDCSGNTPGAYSTITEATLNVTPGGTIAVAGGTCNEWVFLNNLTNISLGANWGERVMIPFLSVYGATNVYLYGLDVKNGSAWAGINIDQSHNVILDNCSSTYNAGPGLSIRGASSAYINGGQYSNNPGGINIVQGSNLFLTAGASINNNTGYGIWAQQANIWTDGGLEIANNTGTYNGYGVFLGSGSRGDFYTWSGENNISRNGAAGVAVDQGSVLLFQGNNNTNLDSNGPTAIMLRAGSHATLGGGVHITNHSNVAIDVLGQSQLTTWNQNVIQNNKGLAAIRVDINSEALIWNATISGNQGPGVWALNNSTVAVEGDTLTNNTGGSVVCDSSSYVITDLAPSVLGSSSGCRISNDSGHHVHLLPPTSTQPRMNPVKAAEDHFRRLATRPK